MKPIDRVRIRKDILGYINVLKKFYGHHVLFFHDRCYIRSGYRDRPRTLRLPSYLWLLDMVLVLVVLSSFF